MNMNIQLRDEIVDLFLYDRKIGSFDRPYFMSGDTFDEMMSDLNSNDFEWYFNSPDKEIVLSKKGSNKYCFRSSGNSFYFDKKVAIKLSGFIGYLINL